MNRYFLSLTVSLGMQSAFSQILPRIQSFEGSSDDNWNFNAAPLACNANGDVWDRVSDGGKYFLPAPDGTYFWEFYDIDEIPGVPADGVCHLTFETIELSSMAECTLSFDYCNRGLDTTDAMSYTLAFDNHDSWESGSEVLLPKHTADVATWFTIQIPVPAEAQHCRLRLSAKANFSADCGGFDNIRLQEGGMAQPLLVIKEPATGVFFQNSIFSTSIVGTSTNLAGVIVWSNALNNATGEATASCDWCVPCMPLAEGKNNISLTATNALGMSAVATISLLRGRSLEINGPGKIAFIAFNSAGDSFAFTALEKLPAGIVIHFSDNEWNGVNFGSSEDDLVWSNSFATAAGAVVTFFHCDDVKIISNNLGVVVNGKLRLAQSGDEIYAYCGNVHQPTAFLAAISTAGANLNGTGLVYGETAVVISKTPTSQYYSGARRTQKQWREYLPKINSTSNWSATTGASASWGDTAPFARASGATLLMVQ